MKRIITVIALLISLLLFITGCGNADDGSKGIFYEVHGGENQVYLFGSIHVGNEDLYPLHGNVSKAFSKSDVLGLEVDLSTVSEIEIVQELLEMGMYNDGSKMRDYVSEDTFNQVLEVVEPYGIDAFTLDHFKPWYAAMMIAELEMEDVGFTEEFGIETYFMGKADNKEIIGLETLKDQLTPFLKLSDDSQVIYLENSLEELGALEEDMDLLVESWKNGDVEFFADLREEMIKSSPTSSYEAYQRALLDGRDEKMAQNIAELLEKDDGMTYFLVVGSLHLAGENSIVEQLTDMGYEVKLGY